jgi:hypothetical protein
VLFEDALPLGGAPTHTVAAHTVPVTRRAAAQGIAGLFTSNGVSTVAGRAALLPRGVLSEETIEEVTTAGAVSVLVDGLLPAGAFSLDVPAGVPVVGLPSQLVGEIRSMLSAGIPVLVAVGAADFVENEAGGAVAAFSSHGLAFDGGLKPDLVAAGVAVATSEPGRGEEGEIRYGTVSGTSISAAVTAGAAAVLAQGRPGLPAAGLKGILVGSATPPRDRDATASGAGLLDLRAAVQQEVYAEPASISFGVPVRSTLELEQTLRIHNVSTRAVTISVQSAALAPKGVEITAEPERLRLRPGRTATVVVRAATGALSPKAGAATGELVLAVGGSGAVRVPWAVAVPAADTDLLSRVAIAPTGGRVSDATPSVLSLVAGAVTPTPAPQVRSLDVLEVQLYRGDILLGVLARRREVLPGRYTFGLTGRGPGGDRLRRGKYVIRVVARPGKGVRRQVETVDYLVR